MNIEEGISKKEEQKIITKETPLTIENRNVKISEFVDARSLEVSEFTNLLKTKLVSHNKLAFQLLPKHMRRRAMSHNRYRTPARIRNKLEEKDIELKKPIRCRKHLRKKKLLLISYMKRSAKAKWLETHIWHAKRMKMMSYFGYKVAQKAHAKSGRAAYSYLSRDCLIYDMSYYIILEIKALKNKIFTIVEEIADSESSEWTQFCNSKQIQGGGRKGELTLFYREKDNPNAPKRMIQKVEYIWKPVKDPDEPTKIWFFLHPSTQDIVQEFINSKAGDKECELKLHQNNFDFFHLLGPTSCSKLYSLIKKLDLTEQSKEQVWNKELLNWMEVIEDPGTYPKGFILHLSLELNPNSKLIQFPKSIPQDQIESNFNNQANFNTYISRLLFYDYGVSPEASELKLWDPPSDIFLPAKDIQTRGRYTHKKKEYLKAQEKNKKKPKNSTNKSEPQNITNENPPEKIIPEEPLTQLPQSEMIPEENKEQKRELIELIVIHDEGEKKTAKGAGLKIIVNGGGGLKIWK
jgi:Ribonucleases P/MRP protein subunit POP1.